MRRCRTGRMRLNPGRLQGAQACAHCENSRAVPCDAAALQRRGLKRAFSARCRFVTMAQTLRQLAKAEAAQPAGFAAAQPGERANAAKAPPRLAREGAVCRPQQHTESRGKSRQAAMPCAVRAFLPGTAPRRRPLRRKARHSSRALRRTGATAPFPAPAHPPP